MKKMVCLVLALVLCLNVAALAEYVPSKTTEDMTQIEVSAENMPGDASLYIEPVPEDHPDYQQAVMVCEEEISALAATTVVEYFGEVKDSEGNPVDLTEMLGTQDLKVYEYIPLVAGNYEEEYGDVTATMYFSTPYEAGQEVVVMIGFVTIAEDGTWTVEWIAYEGVGVADGQGSGIQVKLDAETVLAIQNGKTLMAIVSK